MNRIKVYGLACALLLSALSARATTIVMPTDEQLIAKAPVIVEGTVQRVEVVDIDGRIWTEAVVKVEQSVKGHTPLTLTVREIGGELGDRITKVFGTPEFEVGERALLFLEPHGDRYRTVDLFVGKFTEGRTAAGTRLWLRHDSAEDAYLLDPELRPVEAGNIQRAAAQFDQFVADRVAGRAGVKNYAVENPVLAPKRSGAARSVTAEFTLIAEPTIYRWFRFENGQSAAWYSSGTQPGYSNGGVSELRTAMATWNDYSAARIAYSYSGNRTGSMGGLDKPNSVNEVLFDDPLDEISGSFNKSTGGVVGIGGFNGISSQQNWDAPFNADETHTAGTKRAWNITEGNLSIQDGVSPANGISSARLAEILAHEFGHTLGFGHSSSTTALMYYSVTGLGSSLRADDQLAARWLYPNGSTPPPPPPTPVPAAPTSLTATVSGNDVDLAWKDNANNETSQAIYVSSGGAYSKVGTLNANVTSARVTDFSPGSYSIFVVASNEGGDSVRSNAVTVTIASAPPVAAFTIERISDLRYRFVDTSSGTVTSREWKFGDGGTATAKSVEHTYAFAGKFTIRLRVSGAGTESVLEKDLHVTGPLVANYTFTPAQPTVSDTIQFTDSSTGAPQAWSWDFGDGTFSTQQNPSKKYSQTGNYTVLLTVSRDGASNTVSRTVPVLSSAPVTPVVNAAFDVSSEAEVGTPVRFTDRSTGSPTSWSWSFGDGATSSAQNPQHVFSGPGTYTVSLTASNATGSSTASRNVTVGGTDAYRTLLSVVTTTSGVGGTSWRTELSVFNAGVQGTNVTFTLLPTPGGNGITRNLFLAARQSITYENVLSELFGMTSGAGALAVEASSAGSVSDLRITSRTFTSAARGTYGQSVPDVEPAQLDRNLYITGIVSSARFRTNIGLVNRHSAPVSTTLTLLNRTGSQVATATRTLAADTFQQTSLTGLFPEIATSSYDVLTLRLSSSSGDAVSAYASVVDNETQDPVFIQAVPAPQTTSMVVPIVGRAAGVNGTFWRSDATFFNPTSSSMTLTLRYEGMTRTVNLGGNDTLVLPDIVAEFGRTSGSGTLHLSWSSQAAPVVTTRTYTTVEGGGTYGQSIDPVAVFGRTSYVPGLRNDSSYRTNVGFVNGGTQAESITVYALSPSGTEIARNTYVLAPGQVLQSGAGSVFRNVVLPAGFTLVVQGDSDAKLFAYASMVDNLSGDPVFFAGR